MSVGGGSVLPSLASGAASDFNLFVRVCEFVSLSDQVIFLLGALAFFFRINSCGQRVLGLVRFSGDNNKNVARGTAAKKSSCYGHTATLDWPSESVLRASCVEYGC